MLRNVSLAGTESGCSATGAPWRGGLRRHLLIADLEVPQDARCGLLDVLARRRDPGDGLVAAPGPVCDVAEAIRKMTTAYERCVRAEKAVKDDDLAAMHRAYGQVFGDYYPA